MQKTHEVSKLQLKTLRSRVRKLKNVLEKTHPYIGMAKRLMRAQVRSGKLPPEALPIIEEMLPVKIYQRPSTKIKKERKKWSMSPKSVAFYLKRK